jgi:hypothetical protein
MPSRLFLSVVSMAVLLLVGMLVIAQSGAQTFTPIQQLGYTRPSGIEYDPHYDRFVWVQDGLQVVNARTLQTEFTVATNGAFNDYVFSHNGRYLALAIDKRVELWDVNTQSKVAEFAPDGSLSVVGPLFFGDDDRLLQLNSVVPAPQETRRSENDTNIIPYTWDIVAAQEADVTILPNRSDAYAFFNYRNGLVLGQNNTVIAGVPSRLLVIDALNPGEIANEIPAPQRFEQDPITVWQSATDDFMYVQPNGENTLVQVNTRDKSTFQLTLGATINGNLLTQIQNLKLSNLSRRLAQEADSPENSLLRLLLGENYRADYGYQEVSVTLIDWLMPMTMGDDQMGLLVYIYSEARESGVVDLIRPIDSIQMRLSPDNQRVMVRRGSGSYPLEIYHFDTGILEDTLIPTEIDFEGRRILAYNGDGSKIITDFERFDVKSGESIFYDQRYTTIPFNFMWGEDSQTIITFDEASAWRVWDIATGTILDTWQPFITGDVIGNTTDNLQYLMQEFSENGTLLVRYDVLSQTRRETFLPISDSFPIPSPDWRYFAFNNGNVVRVFDENGNQLFYLTSVDLPGGSADSISWYDNETLIVESFNQGNPTLPLYGVDYHPSGLPQCLVQAYPSNWQQFATIWEQFQVNFSSETLNRLTLRLCDNLTENADELLLQLTPTPSTPYFAERTPRPFIIAGVPTCLTGRFVEEALAYAQLWRNMSAGLDEEATKELEEQLCEGLISSLSGVQPTATINPNSLSGPTPTALPDSPDTVTNASSFAPNVMLLNIFTLERTQGDYVPQNPSRPLPTSTNLNLVLQEYQRQFNDNPSSAQLSPDGRLFAVQSGATGFIMIYELGKPYAQVALEASETVQATVTLGRSVGIVPTATQPFVYMGQPNPTLTPTITLTPFPLVEATVAWANLNQQESICPYQQLFDLQNLPDDFVANGRLLTQRFDVGGLWELDPRNGETLLNESLPACQNGNCDEAFDGNWVIRYGNEGVGYSRYDGTDATWVYDATGVGYVGEFSWQGLNTIVNGYNTYYPDEKDPTRIVSTTLYQTIDVETNEASELLPRQSDPIIINNLPTQVLIRQPIFDRFVVVSTPFVGGGEKVYVFDRETATATLFIRTDTNRVDDIFWHPLGTMLYYRTGGVWYVFDPSTQEHAVLGNFYGGKWSRDGRYRVDWFTQSPESYIERVAKGDLPLKIRIWDTQTGLLREYCLPETGTETYSSSFLWSPNNRYIAFQVYLPYAGDFFPPLLPFDAPTPTALPSPTPVNLELEYDLRLPRVLLLDILTGSVTVISDETQMPYAWLGDKGAGK